MLTTLCNLILYQVFSLLHVISRYRAERVSKVISYKSQPITISYYPYSSFASTQSAHCVSDVFKVISQSHHNIQPLWKASIDLIMFQVFVIPPYSTQKAPHQQVYRCFFEANEFVPHACSTLEQEMISLMAIAFVVLEIQCFCSLMEV